MPARRGITWRTLSLRGYRLHYVIVVASQRARSTDTIERIGQFVLPDLIRSQMFSLLRRTPAYSNGSVLGPSPPLAPCVNAAFVPELQSAPLAHVSPSSCLKHRHNSPDCFSAFNRWTIYNQLLRILRPQKGL